MHHVGSTAVPGLTAKPVIDIDLTVPDVADEASYLPELEGAGFTLVFRDCLGRDAHRQLTYGDPNANLHVWGPGARSVNGSSSARPIDSRSLPPPEFTGIAQL